MADDCLFDNEESDDERAVREEAEVTLDLKDRWFGIANSTGTYNLNHTIKGSIACSNNERKNNKNKMEIFHDFCLPPSNGTFCSSQPSIVRWLSSSIFPCLVVRPAMVTSDQISLLVAPHPQTHTFSESL